MKLKNEQVMKELEEKRAQLSEELKKIEFLQNINGDVKTDDLVIEEDNDEDESGYKKKLFQT